MRNALLAFTFLGISALAACGGTSTGGGIVPVGGQPTAAPFVSQASVKGTTAWVTPGGAALYTFDGDTAGTSTCTGGCLSIWPSFAAAAGATPQGDFTLITRTDNGTMQWVYLNKPLYTFVNDSGTNQGTGDGVNGFHIARPAGTVAGGPTAPPNCTGIYC